MATQVRRACLSDSCPETAAHPPAQATPVLAKCHVKRGLPVSA